MDLIYLLKADAIILFRVWRFWGVNCKPDTTGKYEQLIVCSLFGSGHFSMILEKCARAL